MIIGLSDIWPKNNLGKQKLPYFDLFILYVKDDISLDIVNVYCFYGCM